MQRNPICRQYNLFLMRVWLLFNPTRDSVKHEERARANCADGSLDQRGRFFSLQTPALALYHQFFSSWNAQNHRGWKRPLEVTWSNPSAQAGTSRAGPHPSQDGMCPGPHPLPNCCIRCRKWERCSLGCPMHKKVIDLHFTVLVRRQLGRIQNQLELFVGLVHLSTMALSKTSTCCLKARWRSA